MKIMQIGGSWSPILFMELCINDNKFNKMLAIIIILLHFISYKIRDTVIYVIMRHVGHS